MEPSSLDLADLHKLLPFWQKQAADEKNKFAANNKKLAQAIQEAIKFQQYTQQQQQQIMQ